MPKTNDACPSCGSIKHEHAVKLSPKLHGANGAPLGFDEERNLTELMRCDLCDEGNYSLTVLRSVWIIAEHYQACSERVWWNRHQYHRHQIESGEETLPEEVRPFFETGRREAKRILRKYGKKKLVLNDFEWGYLNGQHETAAWVLGAEWDEAGDT